MAYYIYGDESGHFGVNYFSIGLLFVDPGANRKLEEEISKLRKKHNFFFEIAYKTTSEVKLSFYNYIIDFFFTTKELKFCATVVECKLFNLNLYRGRNISPEELSYNVIYKNTVKNNINREIKNGKVVLILDRKSKARPQDFKKYMCREIPNIADMQEVDSRNHNLIQLTDLLLGCVNGDLNNVQNWAKRKVIDKIQERLSITNYKEKNSYTKAKFDIWFWKPSISP